MDDPQIKVFVERTDEFKEKLNEASKLVYHTKPHPVDREALNSYLDSLKVRGKSWSHPGSTLNAPDTLFR